jgi:hypothetical protein
VQLRLTAPGRSSNDELILICFQFSLIEESEVEEIIFFAGLRKQKKLRANVCGANSKQARLATDSDL